MFRLIGYLGANIITLMVLANFLSNFEVNGIGAAAAFVIVLTLFNWTVVPLVKILAIPASILTFGLINVVINLATIIITANIIEDIAITGSTFEAFIVAIVIAFAMGFAQTIVDHFTKHKN